jgi:hypothetical protein
MLSSTPAPEPTDVPAVTPALSSCDCCAECAGAVDVSAAVDQYPIERSTTLSDLATLFSVLSVIFYVTRGK